jgi:predicted DNA-binding transcriptional regulator AlpA
VFKTIDLNINESSVIWSGFFNTQNLLIEKKNSPRATIYNIMDERHKHYDPTFPRPVRLSESRIGWSAWEIHQWIEDKLESRE